MNELSSPPDDDLARLWQSEAPAFDPKEVRSVIDHDRRLQRLTVNLCILGGVLVLAFVVWIESQGVTRAPYLLSALIAASILWQVRVTIRARRRMPDVASLSPERLLRHAIARARTTLRNARLLYIGNPMGVLIGFLLGPIIAAEPADDRAMLVGTLAIALAFLAAVIVGALFGLRMARSARHRIAVLEERLKNVSIEA